jgi:hypothetical protein
VHHKFPDAVSVGQRPSRSPRGIHIFEQLKQCGTVPGVTFERAAQLLSDQGSLGNGRSHIETFL